MPLTLTQRGLLSVFGGFTLHLVMGSIFMWGTLNVYVTSYFRQLNDDGLSLSLGGAIFPVMMACLATGMPIGLKLVQYVGSSRYYCMGVSIICAALVFASSYSQKFWQYILIYGIGYGLVSGTNYFVPIYLGYLYFPKKKGLVSGIILGGYGLCSLVFGLIFTALVNPDNLLQQKNSDGYSYYEGKSVSVAQKVPSVLRKMSYMYVAVSVFGCFFLMHHPDQFSKQEQSQKKQQTQTEQASEKITYELNTLNDGKQNTKMQNEEQTSKSKSDKIKDDDLAEDKDIDAANQNSDNLVSLKKLSPMKQTQHSFNNQKNTNNTNNNNEEEEDKLNNENRIENEKNNNSDPNLQIPSSPNKEIHQNQFVLQDQAITIDIDNANGTKKQQDQVNDKTNDQPISDVAKIEQLDKLGAPTIKLALSQQQLYVSFVLAYFAIGFGVIVNGNFKSIAKDYGFNNEDYLNVVGALVSTANGISRIFWASLLDRFTFKQILSAILIVQIIFSLTIRLSKAHEVFYAIWAFVINACFGGVLGIWPAFSASLNGVKIGSQIYGLYWYSFSLANFTQFLFVNYLKKTLGFNNIFYIYTGFAAAALILLWSYQFKIKWSKYYIKEEKEQRTETEQQPLKQLAVTNPQP